MPSGQHHPVLYFAIREIYHLVKQESTARGSGKSGADELRAIRQIRVAGGTREQPGSAHVLKEYPAHPDLCILDTRIKGLCKKGVLWN